LITLLSPQKNPIFTFLFKKPRHGFLAGFKMREGLKQAAMQRGKPDPKGGTPKKSSFDYAQDDKRIN
jgi:hypothetical protein